MINDTPLNYCGMKVYIRDRVWTRKLTWGERLFSWPWRPWVSTISVPNPIFANGDIYQIGDRLWMTEESWRELQRRTG